jgi:hypothetical protein
MGKREKCVFERDKYDVRKRGKDMLLVWAMGKREINVCV